MTDENYTKREQDHFINEWNSRMDKQDATLARIETQTTKTNGRVNLIEEKIKDYPDIKKSINELMNYKFWILGAIAAFTLFGGSILYFINHDIDNKIAQGIDSAFNSRFDKVEVIQK